MNVKLDASTAFPQEKFTCEPFKYELAGSPFALARRRRPPLRIAWQCTLAMPDTTAWEPALAQQLMTGLFALAVPLRLGIKATAEQITWYLGVPHTNASMITDSVYAVYHQADLKEEVQPGLHLGYYRFPLQGAVPFPFPLKAVEACQAFDPLATLLSPMRALRSGEEWIYELVLAPPDRASLELGYQLLQEWIGYGWFQGEASNLHALQDKMNAPLKAVTLAMKIKADTAERAYHLADSSWSTWAQFAKDGHNALAVPGPGTFQLVLSPAEVAALWHPPHAQLNIQGISWTQAVTTPIPVPLINLQRGIVLGTNSYQGREYQARLTYEDRYAHISIIGMTGSGKSTLVQNMSAQDIEVGKGVGLIDSSDLANDLLGSSIPTRRERDVIVFDTRDPDCSGLNALAVPPGVPPYLVARQALDLIKKICADDWPGAQTERYFAAALRALVELPGATLLDVPRLLGDKAFRAQVTARLTDDIVRQTWLQYDRLNPGSQAKISEPILNRLDRFYSDPVLARIICQPDSLDFRQIIEDQKIFVADLGAFQEEREANTLGALLLSKFQLAAMSRGEASKAERQAKTYYLYVDELQRYITTSLPIIYTQARKYGLSLTGAFQHLGQMPGDDLRAITSGVGVSIIFRTLKEDAKALAPFMGEHITANNLTTLSQGTAIASVQLDGQPLPSFSIRTLPPINLPADAEKTIARIKALSRATYGSSQDRVADRFEQPLSDEFDEDNDDPQAATFVG